MPRFFVSNPLKVGCNVIIEGEDAFHIGKSLRMKVGENIILCNQDGFDYNCKILSVDKKTVVCDTLSRTENCTEPKNKITIYQALPKSDKMELIIQKSVEIGACGIVPFSSERCIAKIENNADAQKKNLRWQKIADEAAKQCGRGKIPKVSMPLTLKEACDEIVENDIYFVAYEAVTHDTKTLKKFLIENIEKTKNENTSLGFIIGAEGGFSAEEIAYMQQKGIDVITLGNRILRCETAAIAVCAMTVYQLEE